MSQEYISIRGARENNLKDVSLRIPKRKITIFTGVSGSGKSSIVFDTVAAEARRQLNETFSTFVRNFLPRYAQPDADAIENLSMAIVVDQKHLGGGSSSTVGTITDIYSVLRLLFSRVGQPFAGYSNAFSFNDPQGMCPECNGIGRKIGVDLDKFLDTSKSLSSGAILYPEYSVESWGWNILIQSGLFDNDKALDDYSEEEMDRLLHGKPYKVKMDFAGKSVNLTSEGIVDKFSRKYITGDVKSYSERTQKSVEPYMTYGPCTLCKGARLSQAALGCKIDGYNIAQLAAMEVDELIEVIRAIENPIAAPMVASLVERLQHMIDIGLEYLSLSRETDTLSGGESQRIKMVKHLGSSLVDVTYVFDEPSIGMHPRDVHRLNELLQKLRDKGNTVIVVEHDPDVIKVADHVVDVGPFAGTRGGTIVFEGSYADLRNADTLTGRHMKQSTPIKSSWRAAKGKLSITNARANNLHDVSVDIPTGVLTVVTGVAGSGKSSLIHQSFLRQHPDVIVIDQSPVGVSSRSNPATYTGILDEVRKTFAKVNKVSPSLFSFNSKGACENCQGLGVVYTDLAYMDEVKTPCEICGGKRFKDEVLTYKFHDKSISDVLNMPVREALEFFDAKEVAKDVMRKLQALSDVGLDYLTLGQPLSTLSGGECQRIKLASELHKKGSVYVMDEPTTGLHMSDIGHLLAIINRLADAGNTVIIIEHNLAVIKNADWIIDMGPEGGSKGGRVMFEGTPQQLLDCKQSLTSAYLRD
ncbi:ATP-binding cassette domain-containing protein [Capsulimonas corticalis]|uniref:ATP-binding cassette domain-containing protein n=1 Tax=Capsulimonas corticalis TaxID=2219043 RepID=UPI001C3F8A93|nr:excinuclease ABC subunit UvrA [Capsulimonas corticalis]